MAHFKDISGRTHDRPLERQQTSGFANRSKYLPTGSFAPEAPDIPVPLKGMRAVPTCDTGLAFQVAQTGTKHNRPPVMGLQELLRLHKAGFVHLHQPILVGITVKRGRERVKVFSESREIRHFSLMLRIQCRLGLEVGSEIDMELHLAEGEPPLTVRGKVRKISQSKGRDTTRYALEVEFERMGKDAEKRMAAFIHDAESHDRRPMLA